MTRHLLIVPLAAVFVCAGHVQGQAVYYGEWDDDFDELPEIPRHAVHLPPMELGQQWYPAGLVLFFQNTGVVRFWDPHSAETLSDTQSPGVNLFCSGHAFDKTGRVVFASGATGTGGQCGIDDVIVADPHGSSPLTLNMDDGRWYPTCVTDANGDVWLFGGNVTVPNNDPPDCDSNPTLEYFDAGDDKIEMITNLILAPHPGVYPKMFLMGGSNAPGDFAFVGPRLDAQDGRTHWFSTANPQSNFLAGPVTALSQEHGRKVRQRATSALLPVDLRDDPPVERVLVIGGLADVNPPLLNSCEILEYNDDPQVEDWEWRYTAEPLHNARIRADVVLLANGVPFLVGGIEGQGTDSRYACPVFTPEIYIEGHDEWYEVDEDHLYARGYHSVALMLADGSVWVAGQDEDAYCGQIQYLFPGLKLEVFRPWYMFEDRPVITAPAGQTTIERGGDDFEVTYTHAGQRPIEFVALRSLCSVTHSTNFSQRYLILEHVDHPTEPNTLVVTPPDPEYAPPGPYMLIIADNYVDGVRRNVPSVAQFVYLE